MQFVNNCAEKTVKSYFYSQNTNNMRVIITKDFDQMSVWAANFVAKKILDFNPTEEHPFVLGCPTGSSPLGLYKHLVELNKRGVLSFKNVVTFNMDEYVGLPVEHPESYHSFMWTNFFGHIDIKPENVHILDGNAKDLLAECITLNGCKTGEAKITKGYKLNAKYVIHTPGPIWRGGDWGESELLKNCYRNCLKLAVENGIESIAFPSISTGVYRFPKGLAAEIALNEILTFLKDNKSITLVKLVCFDEDMLKLYKETFERLTSK